MTAKLRTLAIAIALTASAGFVHSAAGEPEEAPAGDDNRALPERTEAAPSTELDPHLLARLEQLEGARRAARVQGLEDPKAWADGRAERARRHRDEIAGLWGDVAFTVDAQARLRLHAERMSRLNRLLDLAEHGKDRVLIARVHKDIGRELARHARAMQAVGLAGGE